MQLENSRVLVAGATGAIGQQLVHALLEAGARVVPAGRDADRLAPLAQACGTTSQVFDVIDTASVRSAVDAAAAELGGLDALVVTVGVAGFGDAMSADPAVTEELFAVNALGPMSLVRAAAPHLSEGGRVAVVSAILADMPTAWMADYSAAKCALAAWLEVVRREQRRAFGVLDVRPPHLDTGLDQRALTGEPPKMPTPYPAADVVAAIVQAMRDDAKELVWDQKAKELQAR
jgi:NAD(P)-dependent dehydrogenase (short-subunit alcohol dehydrogenase family)